MGLPRLAVSYRFPGLPKTLGYSEWLASLLKTA
ncbi:hypothetical protein FHS83_003653 [Rhizomicrobium palustre]|uniref:Uncharacterized protein n=1 Tax=Rhizomicrobium palustre TaxID=189966 RepID=A0A846N4D7_9PROT|nr:hypothetical protein [Rhizomicrobium palustre]